MNELSRTFDRKPNPVPEGFIGEGCLFMHFGWKLGDWEFGYGLQDGSMLVASIRPKCLIQNPDRLHFETRSKSETRNQPWYLVSGYPSRSQTVPNLLRQCHQDLDSWRYSNYVKELHSTPFFSELHRQVGVVYLTTRYSALLNVALRDTQPSFVDQLNDAYLNSKIETARMHCPLPIWMIQSGSMDDQVICIDPTSTGLNSSTGDITFQNSHADRRFLGGACDGTHPLSHSNRIPFMISPTLDHNIGLDLKARRAVIQGVRTAWHDEMARQVNGLHGRSCEASGEASVGLGRSLWSCEVWKDEGSVLSPVDSKLFGWVEQMEIEGIVRSRRELKIETRYESIAGFGSF